MRTVVKVALSLAVVLGFLALAQADDKDKEKTLKGTITCAKCDLKLAKACHTVIKVKDDVYWFAKDSSDYKQTHKEICQAAKEGTVKGVVSEKDGKKWIKASKVEFEK
jgi:hypothetical protein